MPHKFHTTTCGTECQHSAISSISEAVDKRCKEYDCQQRYDSFPRPSTTSRDKTDTAEITTTPLIEKCSAVQKSPGIVLASTSKVVESRALHQQTSLLNSELVSRLKGLQTFQRWNLSIHESAVEHDKALEKARAKNAAVIGTVYSNSSADRGISVASSELLLQPRSFSFHDTTNTHQISEVHEPSSASPVTPVPIQNSQSEISASPASRNLTEQTLCSNERIPTYKPETSTAASTALEESKSQPPSSLDSGANTRPRSRSRVGGKRYPPISFPRAFNERYAKADLACNTVKPPISHAKLNTGSATPSISSLSRPNPASCAQDKFFEPHATLHDVQARPNFYNIIHHYTDCPHTCPPASRPLDPNAQPRLQLDARTNNHAASNSVIPGKCFNCDTSYRRRCENKILTKYTEKIINLKDMLAILVEELEVMANNLGDIKMASRHDKGCVMSNTTCVSTEDAIHLRYQQSCSSLPALSNNPAAKSQCFECLKQQCVGSQIVSNIREIEATIDKLRQEQDAEVKMVWEGYTQRWGPATLGVQKGFCMNKANQVQPETDYRLFLSNNKSDRSEVSDIPSSDSRIILGHNIKNDGNLVEVTEDAKRDGGKISLHTNTTANEDNLASGSEGTASTGRSDYMRSNPSRTSTPTSQWTARSKHASTPSHRDIPGSRTPGEGKMRVGWVREEKGHW